MNLYQNKLLRQVVIPTLKFLNPGKISIRHHYTGNRFVLDAFKHKGYWYHGRSRESDTMHLFEKLVSPHFIVIEVGRHIGYISTYFSHLLSKGGQIYVFEPGENNLPYLKENISKLTNVHLIEKGIADHNGVSRFFIEDLSGQNNSLLSDYANAEEVKKNAHVKVTKRTVEIEVTTLTDFCNIHDLLPDFIKIDIEGAELYAISGGIEVLRKCKPMLMVEITQNEDEVFSMLGAEGYLCYDDKKRRIESADKISGNTFCFHIEKHHAILNELKMDIRL